MKQVETTSYAVVTKFQFLQVGKFRESLQTCQSNIDQAQRFEVAELFC